ncbi:ubiquinol-cytochrome C chaperone [Sphingomonas lutea]|uniref:Ubiquinol-cytochrome C chaperone n=1 Tax=Sphingomonas lutea TaxID=1045317 RepID=A0A7G9SIM9_9SPHN|nr:ubiquinol-cytochrome C chaperone family protein [Sphingomonas lutea]QNN67704.1 ubiquinol-cytochrome C chaperone [Sphingomonas lutea]
MIVEPFVALRGRPVGMRRLACAPPPLNMLAATGGASPPHARGKDPMLRFLFPGLTADPARGAAAFDAVTREARKAHWYVASGVPDDLDGRFRVLSTIAALVTIRLEQLGAQRESVALTERFIEVMESEHRELGLGDPTLGKTVRRLVGALSRRIEIWRTALDGGDWTAAARESLYAEDVAADAAAHAGKELRVIWQRLEAADAPAIAEGKFA